MRLRDPQDMLDAMDGVAYVVDRDGVVVLRGGRATKLLPDDAKHPAVPIVCGSPFYDSLDGEPVKEIYRRLLDMVWSRRKPGASFNYRSDLPGVERIMRMSLGLILNNGEPVGVLCQTVLIREVARVPLPLLDTLSAPAGRRLRAGLQTVVLCAFCLDVGWPPDCGEAPIEWISAPDYYRRGGRSDVTISHGVCVPCYDRVLNDSDGTPPFTQLS